MTERRSVVWADCVMSVNVLQVLVTEKEPVQALKEVDVSVLEEAIRFGLGTT